MSLNLRDRIRDDSLFGEYVSARVRLFDKDREHVLLGLVGLDRDLKLYCKKPGVFLDRYGNASNMYDAMRRHVRDLIRAAEMIDRFRARVSGD